MARDCVAQAETVQPVHKRNIDPRPIDRLDDARLRDVVRAVAYVMEADCEPA